MINEAKVIEKYAKFIFRTIGWEENKKRFIFKLAVRDIDYFAYVGGQRLSLYCKAPFLDGSLKLYEGTLYGGKEEIQDQVRFVIVSCVGGGEPLKATQGNLEASLFLGASEETHTIEESIEIVNNSKPKTGEKMSFTKSTAQELYEKVSKELSVPKELEDRIREAIKLPTPKRELHIPKEDEIYDSYGYDYVHSALKANGFHVHKDISGAINIKW